MTCPVPISAARELMSNSIRNQGRQETRSAIAPIFDCTVSFPATNDLLDPQGESDLSLAAPIPAGLIEKSNINLVEVTFPGLYG